MSGMTHLAVIMSIYQNDKLEFCKESINSILQQTYTDFDLYIAYDGQVPDEVDDFISGLKDTRIHVQRLEKNTGLAYALNYLLGIVLKNPNYELIARMDADDISLPARFEKQLNFFFSNPDVSCAGTWYEEIDESGNHLHYRKLPTEHDKLLKRYYMRAPFAHPSVMFRRRLIINAGFYPTDTFLMEDNVLWGRALLANLRFANIPEYLLKFRIDKNFYKRRSGLKYGWNFIKTRFKINKSLRFPHYSFLLLLIIGIGKMMPPFILRFFYKHF